MQRLETLQTDSCLDFDNYSVSNVFRVAVKTDEEAGKLYNDNVPQKDKYLTANWRNLYITSMSASFAVSLKLLLRGLKISPSSSHYVKALELQKLQMKKYPKWKPKAFFFFCFVLFYRKNICFTRECEKREIPSEMMKNIN